MAPITNVFARLPVALQPHPEAAGRGLLFQ